MGTTLFAQQKLFDKFEDRDDVNTVYISKGMFKMIESLPVQLMGNKELDVRKIAGKLDKLVVLETEKKSLVSSISKEALRIYKEEKYEELMRISEGKERTIIYDKDLGGGKHLYALYQNSGEDVKIINLYGSLKVSELKGMIGK